LAFHEEKEEKFSQFCEKIQKEECKRVWGKKLERKKEIL
jgi:hypothetical protein